MQYQLENHLKQLIEALESEKQEELKNYLVNNQQNSLQERIAQQKTIYPLDFSKINYTPFGDLLLKFNISKPTNLKIGTTVEIFNSNSEQINGQIHSLNIDYFEVKINSNHQILEWIKSGKIGLNILPDTKTYDTYLNELKSIEATQIPQSLKFIYDPNRNYETVKDELMINHLNLSQNKAVSQSTLSQNPVEIIHGPPGTGKTTTLVAIIESYVKANQKVLVITPTNTAVDHICQTLIKHTINVCRIGNPIKVDTNIINHTLENLAQNDLLFKVIEQLKKQKETIQKKAFQYKRNFGQAEYIERKKLKNELKNIKKDIKKIQKTIYTNIIEQSPVISGTFIGVLSENLPTNMFDVVIIDEASQAIEPAIWAVSKFANKIILAGDHQQLPPHVESNKAIQLGLHQSILEQAQSFNFQTLFLNEQYRMNEVIMNFSNQQFYNSKLIANTTNQSHTLLNELKSAIEFIDTAGCDFEEIMDEQNYGIYNLGEIGLIEKRLKSLDIETNTFAIISPYALQIQYLFNKLKLDHINTIDSFQGQERDLIILSLVRSNSKNVIGFLKDYRRLNVAMTRARKKLIIIGDSATLGQDDFFNALMTYIETYGTYSSAWEYM
jgi:predicted DNA helicase